MKILVIRFKQIGDALLSSCICESLKKTYPNSQIDYVLYEHVAPLFKNHPAIDNIITIKNSEKDNVFKYIKKVWQVTRADYDIIIDIMSTPKSEWFSLFSRKAKYKIGRKKKKRGYTYTHKILEPKNAKNKIDKFLKMLDPIPNIKKVPLFRIGITTEEKNTMKSKMLNAGIDFSKPIFIFSVTSRVAHKVWPKKYMEKLVRYCLDKYDGQGIFFYAPNQENEVKELEKSIDDNRIFSNIKTSSIKELSTLISLCDMYIGNEGGPRHIAQAVDTPSYAIFSPGAKMREWLIESKRHLGIEIDDVLTESEISKLSFEESYKKITPEIVIKNIDKMIKETLCLEK